MEIEVVANSLSRKTEGESLWNSGWHIKSLQKKFKDITYQHSICLLNVKQANSEYFPFKDNAIRVEMKKYNHLLLCFLNPWISYSSFKTNEAEEKLMEVILNRWIYNYCNVKIWINSDFHPPQPSEIPDYCDDITIYIHDITSKLFHSNLLQLIDKVCMKYKYKTAEEKYQTKNMRTVIDDSSKIHIFIFEEYSMKDLASIVGDLNENNGSLVKKVDMKELGKSCKGEIIRTIGEYTIIDPQFTIDLLVRDEREIKIIAKPNSSNNTIAWNLSTLEAIGRVFLLYAYSETNVEVKRRMKQVEPINEENLYAPRTEEQLEIAIKLPACFTTPPDMDCTFERLGKQKYLNISFTKFPNWQYMNILKKFGDDEFGKYLEKYEFREENRKENFIKSGKTSIVLAVPPYVNDYSISVENGILSLQLLKNTHIFQ